MKPLEQVEEFIYIFQEDNVYEQIDDFENSKILVNDIQYLNNVARQIKESGLYMTPTLVIFEMILQYFDEEKFAKLQKHPEPNYLTRGEYEKYLTEKKNYGVDLMGKKIVGIDSEKFFIWMKKFTKILNEHQVSLLTSSDTFDMVAPVFSLHKEFEFLQDSGLKPYDIPKGSTIEGVLLKGKWYNRKQLDKMLNEVEIQTLKIKA